MHHEILQQLTKRQIQILTGIKEGLTSKSIAENLQLSRHTVDTHRRRILAKTKSKTMAELIHVATKLNII
jgi:two-component system response regulator FixJ